MPDALNNLLWFFGGALSMLVILYLVGTYFTG